MTDQNLTLTLRKILETMKRGEKSSTVVKVSYIKENDDATLNLIKEKLGDSFDENGILIIELELLRLIKVDDWFKDGQVLKRTI